MSGIESTPPGGPPQQPPSDNRITGQLKIGDKIYTFSVEKPKDGGAEDNIKTAIAALAEHIIRQYTHTKGEITGTITAKLDADKITVLNSQNESVEIPVPVQEAADQANSLFQSMQTYIQFYGHALRPGSSPNPRTMSLTPTPTEQDKRKELTKEGGIMNSLQQVLANTKLNEEQKRTEFYKTLNQFAKDKNNHLTPQQAGDNGFLKGFTTTDKLKELIEYELRTKLTQEKPDLLNTLESITLTKRKK